MGGDRLLQKELIHLFVHLSVTKEYLSYATYVPGTVLSGKLNKGQISNDFCVTTHIAYYGKTDNGSNKD